MAHVLPLSVLPFGAPFARVHREYASAIPAQLESPISYLHDCDITRPAGRFLQILVALLPSALYPLDTAKLSSISIDYFIGHSKAKGETAALHS